MIEIVLEGPGKNALGTPVMQKALADVRQARGEPLLLRGAGDTFCAGLNLKEIAALDAPGMAAYLALFDELVVTLLGHEAPVVACLNGHAIAGGCVLALCCDLRVASDSESLRIGLNEVAIGLIYPPRVLKLARARLAPSHLARVLLEAGLYSGAESLRLGLVHELAGDAHASASIVLARLASHPREAYVEAKRELNRSVLDLEPAEQEAFRTRVLPRWSSPELKQMALAVLAKR